MKHNVLMGGGGLKAACSMAQTDPGKAQAGALSLGWMFAPSSRLQARHTKTVIFPTTPFPLCLPVGGGRSSDGAVRLVGNTWADCWPGAPGPSMVLKSLTSSLLSLLLQATSRLGLVWPYYYYYYNLHLTLWWLTIHIIDSLVWS